MITEFYEWGLEPSIHTARHCYATHHIECGTDLIYLKEQLGHKQLKTNISNVVLIVRPCLFNFSGKLSCNFLYVLDAYNP